MRKLLILCAVAFSLGGCVNGRSIVDLATTQIVNPVGPVDIYRTKTVYASVLEVVVGYREYCWSKPYAVLMKDPIAGPVCKQRRRNVRVMQAADLKATSAIEKAESFIRVNPTISAVSVLTAAWSAVTDFQRTVSNTATAIAAK